MASLRQQIATTALTLTKFRELMRRMQENRPQDDLSIIKKAYDYSLKHHEGQRAPRVSLIWCIRWKWR